MSFDLKYGQQGIWYGQFSHFPENLVAHGVSTRFGGKSAGAFSSMNLAMHNDDDLHTVIENRKIFAKAIGLPAEAFIMAKQVHGDRILAVDETYKGRGAFDYESAIEGMDGLITNTPGLPLMMFFADCVPVLVVDPVKKAVGVSHAGWKGTVAKIAQKTILAMEKRFGTASADCLIGIGPSIGRCCYEVGDEVAARFQAAFPAATDEILRKAELGKWNLDLWQANRIQLEEIGVRGENIAVAGTCTACNPAVFFSYRADCGQTGRIAAFICLQK